jgi:hypothetical protein
MKKLLLLFVLLAPMCTFAMINSGKGQNVSPYTDPTYRWLPGNMWHHSDKEKSNSPPVSGNTSTDNTTAQPTKTVNDADGFQGGAIIAFCLALLLVIVAAVLACLPEKYTDSQEDK